MAQRILKPASVYETQGNVNAAQRNNLSLTQQYGVKSGKS